MAFGYDERDEREDGEREVRVVISDKRHSRDIEDLEEEEAGAAAAAEAEAAAGAEAGAAMAREPEAQSARVTPEEAAEVLDFPGAAPQRPQVPTPEPLPSAGTAELHDDVAPWGHEDVQAGSDAAMGGLGGPQEGLGEAEMSDEEQAAAALEMAQLRQVFAGGLSRYLQAQLGLLLNFALIGLGRAPDPTTGLVTQNLAQARLAIDVLEFLVLRLESELHPQDRQQLAQLISDLKYAFMQAVAPQSGGPGGIVPPTG
ncbi:DUF1844 domain-containing protein [bacterium]|nr:DUF1844 domain-containing protein [bacterium]